MSETDPMDIGFDADGDLDLVAGDIVFTAGHDGVVALLDERMKNVKGVWFANEDEGLPLFENQRVTPAQAIIGQKFNRLKAVSAYRTVALTTPGITAAVVKADFDRATRLMTVTYVAQSIYGRSITGTIERPE